VVPCPGKKSIRLAKKGGGSSLLNAGFRRFSPGHPLPPPLFAETNKGELARFFWLRRLFFCPGNEERV